MDKKTSSHSFVLAGILSFTGLFLLFSIISFLIQGVSLDPGIYIISRPGGFFYISFNWLAFLIPCFLFVSSYFLINRSFKRKYLILQGFAVFPFLTLTAITKLLITDPIGISPVKSLLQDSIGIIPGVVVLFLVLGIELLVLFEAYKRLLNKKSGTVKNKLREYILSNLSVFQSGKEVNKDNIKPAAFASQNNDYQHDKILKDRINTEKYLKNSENSRTDIEIMKIQKKPDINTADPEAPVKINENSIPGMVKNKEHASLNRSFENHGSLNFENPDDDIEELECITDESEDDTENNEILMLQKRNTSGKESSNLPEESEKKSAGKTLNIKKYDLPVENLLDDYEDGEYWKIDTETKHYGEILMNTLGEFNISAELTGIRKGPVITMFEILPSPGVKLSKIVGLADNIALRLAASRVRIVAPIPGKQAVGIEIPNKKRSIVSFKELINLNIFKKTRYELPIILGKDISGEAQIIDLVQTPHLLIAGATGSGKSVCVNSLISSLLFKKTPEEVRLLLIDPKMVELKMYNDIPHLLTPVITEPKHSFQALQYCLYEMERRYSLLDSVGVRDIRSFNKKIREKNLATEKLPYIVIVVDEFADLMATTGKELEATISRLASMSRAVGIHLVLATQRPSVDVITGLIKANIPCRIAFMVASKFDSRIIIDSVGAEKLLGQGDMLFASAWDPVPIRIQGSFLSEEEVESVTDYLKTLGEPDYIDEEIFFDDEDENIYNTTSDDPMMEKALNIIINHGKASTSYLQRRLKIGYNRAARLMEELEERGIVGPPNGSKPREILHVPALDQ